MSMTMYVVFRGKLPNKRELSCAMAEFGFPFTISRGSLERQEGYMPMRFLREESGVEFAVENSREEIDEIAKDIDPSLNRTASFCWGGAEEEMLAGMCASAALAKLVNGIVVEDQEGKQFSPDEAAAFARQHLQYYLNETDLQRRATRPADIKHYLRPLLKQRRDLVLRGRYLCVRPVRHFLRGAYLDRSSDRYRFAIQEYLKPLWLDLDGFRGSLHRHLWDVWQPHFEPLLMEALGSDIFEPLGAITDFADLAATLPFQFRTGALLLAGEPERAQEHVRCVEEHFAGESYWLPWVSEQRQLLSRDIKQICAESHAREAAAVKALKLERVWEPSPFPVELPVGERKHRTAEPMFAIEPWVAQPAGLLLEVPQTVGNVHFAKNRLYRDGHPILVAVLTREEAEERHRYEEDYVLAVRRADRLLVLLRWEGRDRRDPDRIRYPRIRARSSVFLELYGTNFFARTEFDKSFGDDALLKLHSVDVAQRSNDRSIWLYYRYGRKATIRSYHADEGRSVIDKEIELSETDLAELACIPPAFGEVESLITIVLKVLRTQGYGEIA